MDPDARKYDCGYGDSARGLLGDEPAGIADEMTINSLDLRVGAEFFYWFDFGDDWCPSIEVVSIEAKSPRGRFRKVIDSIGASPPQYLHLDGEWDDDDEYDEDADVDSASEAEIDELQITPDDEPPRTPRYPA